jgi:hypothetical protein
MAIYILPMCIRKNTLIIMRIENEFYIFIQAI